MPSILIITKDGSIQEEKVLNEELLYKMAGFRNDTGFLVQHVFTISLNDIHYQISLYGKTKGKSIDINKYDFTPYCTKKMIGNCLLVHHSSNNTIVSLLLNEWNEIKEKIILESMKKQIQPIVILSKKGVKGNGGGNKNEVKSNSKKETKKETKKDIKQIANINVEDSNGLSNSYLQCSKELTFEHFV